uniref:Uncharacterized protein n=1 Tax=Oryza meridionalis TaxID=40149 RepID=A0A0E0CEF0_9ORYZ
MAGDLYGARRERSGRVEKKKKARKTGEASVPTPEASRMRLASRDSDSASPGRPNRPQFWAGLVVGRMAEAEEGCRARCGRVRWGVEFSTTSASEAGWWTGRWLYKGDGCYGGRHAAAW